MKVGGSLFSVGPRCCERMFHGWCLVLLLLVTFLGVLAMIYVAAHLRTVKTAEWQVRVPPIPTAFTGREEEIQHIVDLVSIEHVSIISITGGPAYGKSSLAIVSSHRLMERGIPVYYVSLSVANSIETFIIAFMHATATKKTEEAPHKNEVLHWVSSLEANTVVILDNADHLALNEQNRNEFLVLLKDIVAASSYVHLVVTTRYRFQIADDFEETHVQPLESPEAVALLKDLLATKGGDHNENVDFEVIVNKTGGIPLAIKVVGRLLKSKALSGVEIVKKLSTNPLNTLSKERFTPDEQLRHCFDLSFKYLKPHEQKCFHYASIFPGSFHQKASHAIITALVGEEDCLEHLVDRSLVEYSHMASRYTMHPLLRAFARDAVTKRCQKQRYFKLFTEHYMALLSDYITEARTGGNISNLYSTIVEDYHNFLHVMQLYVNGTIDRSVRHTDVLTFAVDTFDIMQPRFPCDVLEGWWTKILYNTCSTVKLDMSSIDLLLPQFLKLSTKFGELLLHFNKISHAKRTLQFADRCIRSFRPYWMGQCSHPHHSLYIAMLQNLKTVYERDGVIHRALNLRTQIYSCIMSSSQSWVDPGSAMPEDVCSDGVGHLKQQARNSRYVQPILLLFDALFRCNMLPAAREELQRAENTFYSQQFRTQHKRITAIAAIAKRFHQILNYKKEVQWLMKAEEFALNDFSLFSLHFRLTRLYWHKLDNQEQAIQHGKSAYHFAQRVMNHDLIFQAAVRLADILHQVDGKHTEAGQYFQEALDRLPFIHADADFIFSYEEFAVGHLMSIYYETSQYITLFRHYGQWAELEMSQTVRGVRYILDLPYNPPVSSSTGLAETDDSINHILGIGSTTKQFLNFCIVHVYRLAFFYVAIIFILLAILIFSIVILILVCIFCIPTFCTTITIVTLMFTLIRHSVLLPLYCVHYFLFHVFTKRKLWLPHKAPIVPKPIVNAFWCNFVSVLACTPVIAFLLTSMGLYLYLTHSNFVVSSTRQYHNMTMNIRDESFYNIYS